MTNINPAQRAIEIILASYDRSVNIATLGESASDVYAIYKEVEDLVTDDAQTCAEVLADDRIVAIRRELREGYFSCVFELEKQWAMRVLETQPTLDIMQSYPKYEQYRLRVFFEYYVLVTLKNLFPKSALFVGCGPFPITPIMLTKLFPVEVDYLDKHPAAIDLARSLTRHLGVSLSSEFFLCDVCHFYDFGKYDIVLVAQSVGHDEVEKKEILQHFSRQLRTGQLLVLRPPYLLERLLISEIDTEDLHGFRLTSAQIWNEEDLIYRLVAEKSDLA